jgi:large subunit ribosomal protein L15
MPLQRRLPKRGFTNIFKKKIAVINIADLSGFENESTVDVDALIKKGMVKGQYDKVKLLGKGETSHRLTIKLDMVSKGAKEKIESAGGRVEGP